jgi:hypothetical protein
MRTACLIVLMAPAAVFAEPASSPPSSDFVVMDRMDGTSKAGLDVSYLFPNNTGNNSITALRFDAHGEYVLPTGIGGYVQLPITYVHASSTGNPSTSSTGIGDLELGILYATKASSSGLSGVFHAGLTVPTGSTGLDSAVANLVGAFMRLTDFYQSIPQGTSIRLAASPLLRSGQVFARADIGIDANFDADNNTADTFGRFNLGVGVDLGGVSLMGELINLRDMTFKGSGGTGASWINAGAVSVRFNAGGARPYGALTFPLDDDSHELMNAVLTVGIETSLR